MVGMIKIIQIEIKRVLSVKILMIFFVIVMLFSAYSTCSALRRYDIPVSDENKITWNENLKHAKTNFYGAVINKEFLDYMRQKEGKAVYVDEWNLEEIIAVNYEGKSVKDLSDEDISNFYLRRLLNIKVMLEESQIIRYTQEEIELFMQKAAQISEIQFGYAEGWKVLNDDMEIFTTLLVIFISVLLLPLFGTDSKNNMKELYRGTRFGKKQLDQARVFAALIAGVFLYISGMLPFFVIKMVPFGLEGWNQHIQSNRDTFFSLYRITNLQQFLLNAVIGLIALLFAVSLLILITVIMEKIMTSAVVFSFFWILLVLFDQMYLWPVNHYFANFMPLRMTSFSHYYIGNEIYRIFGVSLSCMTWSIALSVVLAQVCLFAAIVSINAKRKKGMY